MKKHTDIHYLREPQVFNITRLSRSTRWRLEREGKFPKRRQISANCVAWLSDEIEAWINTRSIVEGERNEITN